MNTLLPTALAATFMLLAATSHAGELKKDYFGATKPGDWVTQELTSPDGSKSTYTSQRLPDDDGRAVIAMSVKVLAGAGEGSESKSIITLPKDFNFARDFLSYGIFTEKMTMEFSGTSMPIDATTLAAIREASKDFRGAVTFEDTENIDNRTCDRYAYTVTIAGTPPTKESGHLWLDDTLPFGIVRQSAKSFTTNGTVASSFDIRLTGTGTETGTAPAGEATPIEAPEPAIPSVVGLLEGYQAGYLALEVTAKPGSGGRRLQIVLLNKTEAEITVHVPAGDLDLPGSSPVSELLVTIDRAGSAVIAAEGKSGPIPVRQRGNYGPQEGTFTLSCYEGTPLYTGSVTVGPLPK